MNSSQFDTYLYLYDSGTDGFAHQIALDGNGGGGTNARIPAGSAYFTLPTTAQTGTYFILAYSATSTGVGSYSLSVTTPAAIPSTFKVDTTTAPMTGLWWNPNESGWGLSIEQQGPIMFVGWYTYDQSGASTRYFMSDCAVSGNGCSGNIYRIAGGAAPTAPWNGHGPVTTVGTGTLAFSDLNTGTFNFVLNGTAGSKNIVRNVFGTTIVPPAADYTALWWNPNESGWGVFLTQQSATIFAVLFTYDASGNPLRYVASSCAMSGSGCTGTLYKTSGGSAPTVSWIGPVTLTAVGSITFGFTDTNTGTMSFTIDGKPGSKTISRMTFYGTPPTINTTSGQTANNNALTLQTGTGAIARFPLGSVPPSAGTISATLALDSTKNPTLPAGATRVTDVFRLTPSGQHFQTGVSITLPLTSTPAGSNIVVMYRFDDDGTIANLGGQYDATAHTITAVTDHFSSFAGVGVVVGNNAASPSADGCVLLDNSQAPPYSWKNVCVNRTLSISYPNQIPPSFAFGGAGVSSEPCLSGFCNKINWVLPQGSYEVCVEEWRANSALESATLRGSKIVSAPISVNQAWMPSTACSPAYLNVSRFTTVDPNAGGLSPGGCACMDHAGSGSSSGATVYSGSFFGNGTFSNGSCFFYLTISGTITQSMSSQSNGAYTGSARVVGTSVVTATSNQSSCDGTGSEPFDTSTQISGTLPNINWKIDPYFNFSGTLSGASITGTLVETDGGASGSASQHVVLTTQ